MKFSNLDIQEIQKSGAAYIPVSLTYVDNNSNFAHGKHPVCLEKST